MNFYRGSEWRKWDLHIHSPFTKLNDQFNLNGDEGLTSDNESDKKWENFFNVLRKKEIIVVGLTDYFSIDNYKRACSMMGKFKINNH